jgi:hypothetical protein
VTTWYRVFDARARESLSGPLFAFFGSRTLLTPSSVPKTTTRSVWKYIASPPSW